MRRRRFCRVCGAPVRALGLCKRHYYRLRETGDALHLPGTLERAAEEIALIANQYPEIAHVEEDYVLLPSQYFPEPRVAHDTGERRLALAVVERAMADLMGADPGMRADAQAYFTGGPPLMASGALYPFRFSAVCEEFGWEPKYFTRLRDRLLLKQTRPCVRIGHLWGAERRKERALG